MNPLTDPSSISVRPTSLDERRKRSRRALPGQAVITVVDGPCVGSQFETIVRDFVDDHTTFLARCELYVGQRLRVEIEREGRSPQIETAEVIRCRMLSIGRYEIAVEVRRAPEQPKISESQRRHERRRRMLGQ